MAKYFFIIPLVMLVACGQEETHLPAPDLTARQQKLFQTSCALCHAAQNSGAPQVGDDSWNEKWAQGFDTLMRHTLKGTEGMPPFGGCYGCSYDDLETLIQFLAQRGKKREKNE